jgi:D-alanine-D-alanine ligase
MKRILFLMGGQSGEHEISLISGKHILAALDRNLYQPIIVVVQKNSELHWVEEAQIQGLSRNPREIESPRGVPVYLRPYRGPDGVGAVIFSSDHSIHAFDLVFPILHGPGGEDGSIQGLCEFGRIPFVGCDLKSSALGMDKAMTKRLCEHRGIAVAPYVEVYRGEVPSTLPWDYPVFVKPARQGSSLGVEKVKSSNDLASALEAAWKYDSKALVEKAIVGREIEVAVLEEKGEISVAPAAEIIPLREFYTYEAKYVDEKGCELKCPADLSPEQLAQVQAAAKAVFQTLECRGMARIDFFMTPTGQFLLNEVNTIPGFTPISLYPQMMQLLGISYSELISRLIVSSLP